MTAPSVPRQTVSSARAVRAAEREQRRRGCQHDPLDSLAHRILLDVCAARWERHPIRLSRRSTASVMPARDAARAPVPPAVSQEDRARETPAASRACLTRHARETRALARYGARCDAEAVGVEHAERVAPPGPRRRASPRPCPGRARRSPACRPRAPRRRPTARPRAPRTSAGSAPSSDAASRKMSGAGLPRAMRGSSPSTTACEQREPVAVALRLERRTGGGRCWSRPPAARRARASARVSSTAPGIGSAVGISVSSMPSRSRRYSSGVIGRSSVVDQVARRLDRRASDHVALDGPVEHLAPAADDLLRRPRCRSARCRAAGRPCRR